MIRGLIGAWRRALIGAWLASLAACAPPARLATPNPPDVGARTQQDPARPTSTLASPTTQTPPASGPICRAPDATSDPATAIEAASPDELCGLYRERWPVDASNCKVVHVMAPRVAIVSMGSDLYTDYSVIHHGPRGWRRARGDTGPYLDHGLGAMDTAEFRSGEVTETEVGAVWRVDAHVERFNPEADEHMRETAVFTTVCWPVSDVAGITCRTVVTHAEGAWYEGSAADAGEVPEVQTSWDFSGEVEADADGTITYRRNSSDWYRRGPIDDWLQQPCERYVLREPAEGMRSSTPATRRIASGPVTGGLTD